MDDLEGSFQPLHQPDGSRSRGELLSCRMSESPAHGNENEARMWWCFSTVKSRVKSILKSTLKVINYYKLPREVQFFQLCNLHWELDGGFESFFTLPGEVIQFD